MYYMKTTPKCMQANHCPNVKMLQNIVYMTVYGITIIVSVNRLKKNPRSCSWLYLRGWTMDSYLHTLPFVCALKVSESKYGILELV